MHALVNSSSQVCTLPHLVGAWSTSSHLHRSGSEVRFVSWVRLAFVSSFSYVIDCERARFCRSHHNQFVVDDVCCYVVLECSHKQSYNTSKIWHFMWIVDQCLNINMMTCVQVFAYQKDRCNFIWPGRGAATELERRVRCRERSILAQRMSCRTSCWSLCANRSLSIALLFAVVISHELNWFGSLRHGSHS